MAWFFGGRGGSAGVLSKYEWIIDPIDGTKNYSHHIPLYAIQIALLRKDELILGVSNAPGLNELYYAYKGMGAYCGNTRIHVSKTKEIRNAYISFGNINHFSNNHLLGNLVAFVKNGKNVRGIGDAWSYHLLASGRIDAMIDAKTKIWDIAALKVIVEEAGGMVTDFSGSPITKNTKDIIATNGVLHDKVLKYFKGGD